MTQPLDANAILMAGGLETVKFPTMGIPVTMTITGAPEAKQQTNKKGEAETWPDGNPKMVIIVPVHIDLSRFPLQRDPSKADDRGDRSWWIGGYMTATVREAIRAAGASGLEIGGQATVTYVADGQATSRGFDPPKLYSATYVAPSVGNSALMGAPATPAGYAPQTQAQMSAHYVPVPVVNATMASLAPGNGGPAMPPGLDPATWARMTPEQQHTIASAMSVQAGAPGF